MTVPGVVHWVSAGAGVGLHVVTWNGGDGVPYLLVHGLASNCRTWEGVASRLSELGHRVAAVDLRGHGRSDKPDEGYDFATLCADLERVIDAVGFDGPVVAGQSTGGNVVVELAARTAGRVAGVAAVDGGALEISRQFPEWEACLAALAPPGIEGSLAQAVEEELRQAHPDWSDWGIEVTMANYEHLSDGTLRPWLSFDRHVRILRSLWEHRPSALLPTIAVPVLFVLADSGGGWMDDHKRRMAEEIRATAPGAQIEWISPGDHDLHVQFPVEIAELLHRSF